MHGAAPARKTAAIEGVEYRAGSEKEQKPVTQEVPADRRILQAKINTSFFQFRLQAVNIRDKVALSRKALLLSLVYNPRLAGRRQAILPYGNFLYRAARQYRLKLAVAESCLQKIAA